MTAPLVSIGIPTYNRAAMLERVLVMAETQDYPNIEIFISDNHSTDGTEKIGRAAAERNPRIRYIRQPRNIGLHPNLNFCLDQARGEFVALFMDDDEYTPTVIREYVEFFASHPRVGVMCSDWQLIDGEGRVAESRDHSVEPVTPGLEYIDRTIRSGQSSIGCPGAMVRRSALGGIRFDESAPIGFGDFVVWFQVAERADVGHLRKRLWRCRTHASALSCRPVYSVARDFEENVRRYCTGYVRRHPDEAGRVERWRRAMRRYLFWALAYEIALDSRPPRYADRRGRRRTVFEINGYRLTPAERAEAWALLRSYQSGPVQTVVAAVVGALTRMRFTAPLAWASGHSPAFRRLLGLR